MFLHRFEYYWLGTHLGPLPQCMNIEYQTNIVNRYAGIILINLERMARGYRLTE